MANEFGASISGRSAIVNLRSSQLENDVDVAGELLELRTCVGQDFTIFATRTLSISGMGPIPLPPPGEMMRRIQGVKFNCLAARWAKTKKAEKSA